MNVLQLNTSLQSDGGQSTALANRFVAGRKAVDRDVRVVVRDLALDAVPHLTAERFQAFTTPAAGRSERQRAIVAESDALIDELRAADTIVIGLPMYNFGVPSTLKSYFDHVARAGVTFRYTDQGAVGTLTGKRAYVFATRGGRYAGTPNDLETAYVRQFLGFLGITDVQFVYAEGLAISDESKRASLAAADRAIAGINELARLAA
jgi:FMN-dependent NADH-azoreductase